MATFCIIHGIYGHPEGNWFPWIRSELESRGHTVIIPYLPTQQEVLPEDWMNAFDAYADRITHDTIYIGHSLGAALVCTILEQRTAKAAYFVASAVGETDNEFTPMMHMLADRQFDFDAIRAHSPKRVVLHADNDPYLPQDIGERLARNLDAAFVLVPGGGHLNADAGFTEFPQLLEMVLQDES